MTKIVTCKYCEGSGKKGGGFRCSVCNGLGSVRVSSQAIACKHCKGTGKEGGGFKCKTCKGTGFAVIRMVTV